MVLGSQATDKDTLSNLLEKATSGRLGLLVLRAPGPPGAHQGPQGRPQHHPPRELRAGRPAERLVRPSASTSRPSSSAQVESVYEIIDDLVKQIDPETGRRPLGRDGAVRATVWSRQAGGTIAGVTLSAPGQQPVRQPTGGAQVAAAPGPHRSGGQSWPDSGSRHRALASWSCQRPT